MRDNVEHIDTLGDQPQDASLSGDTAAATDLRLPDGQAGNDDGGTVVPESPTDRGFGDLYDADMPGVADEHQAGTAARREVALSDDVHDMPEARTTVLAEQQDEGQDLPSELAEYDHTFDEVVNPVLQRYQEHLQLHKDRGVSPDETLDQLPGFLGVGADKVVFKTEMPDGNPVAVKLMRRDTGLGLGRSHELSDNEVAQTTRDHAAPLLKATGKPKLEQLITADPERGVLVTSFFEGKTAPKMQRRDFRAISERDLSELQATMSSMRELGLAPENKESIIFRRGEGFSIVDYMDVDREDREFRPSTVRFDNLEEFIEDITVDSGWEADRNAAALTGAPRDSYYERPVIRGMARGRLLKMARKIQS